MQRNENAWIISAIGQLNLVTISKLFYGFVSTKLTRQIYIEYIPLGFCFRVINFLIRAKKGIIFLARWFELSCIFIQFFSCKLTWMLTLLDLNSHFRCPEFPVNYRIICSTGHEWKIVQIPLEFLKFSVERSYFFILQQHDIHNYTFPRKFLYPSLPF